MQRCLFVSQATWQNNGGYLSWEVATAKRKSNRGGDGQNTDSRLSPLPPPSLPTPLSSLPALRLRDCLLGINKLGWDNWKL